MSLAVGISAGEKLGIKFLPNCVLGDDADIPPPPDTEAEQQRTMKKLQHEHQTRSHVAGKALLAGVKISRMPNSETLSRAETRDYSVRGCKRGFGGCFSARGSKNPRHFHTEE